MLSCALHFSSSFPTFSFESVVSLQNQNPTTTDGDIPEDIRCLVITPDYPNHFGVSPLLGRWIIPSDAPPGQEPATVVVLSYRFWQQSLSADPAIIGKTISINSTPFTVIGVMPSEFQGFKTEFEPAALWTPIMKQPVILQDRSYLSPEFAPYFLQLFGAGLAYFFY